MKRYLRTKGGNIYDINRYAYHWSTPKGVGLGFSANRSVFIAKSLIEKQSDDLDELCDCYVYEKQIYSLEKRIDGSRYLDRYCLGGYDHHDTVDLDKSPINCLNEFIPEHRKKTYGAIWVTGEDGEPILKPVTKLNEKGDFELL